MKKILTLKSEDFLKGMSLSAHAPLGGIFDVAQGINFFSPSGLGLLMPFHSPTVISTSTVTDSVISMDTYPYDTPYCFAMGDTPRLYRLNMSTDAVENITPTDIGTTPASRGQVAVYKDTLIYSQLTKLGKCTNLTSTTGTVKSSCTSDGITSTLCSSDYHPVFVGPDENVYIGGDHNYTYSVGKWDGTTHTPDKFVLPKGYTITCFEKDAYWLIIGATIGPGQVYANSSSTIFFWNTWATTWTKRYNIPDGIIQGMRRHGDFVYAFTGNAIYKFNTTIIINTVII